MKSVYKKIVAIITSIALSVPFFAVPVLADTTYYSYDYFGLGSSGYVTGIDINVSSIHPVVFSVNYNGSVSYVMYFVLYAGGFSSSSEASAYANLYAKLTGVPKQLNNSSSLNWTYGSTISGNIQTGSYTNNQGQTTYYYISSIGRGPTSSPPLLYNNSSNIAYGHGVYCFSNTDLFTYISSAYININDLVKNYAIYKISGNLVNGYTIATVPSKTWLKNSETIVPVINVNDLPSGNGSASDSGGNAGPSNTPDTGGSNNGSSGSMQQTQQQSIAQGAIAFSIEDGAFTATNNNSNTIESDAVNVTVNNNNELSQENMQYINQIINNSNNDSQENPFQEAISNMNQFNAIARAFATLAGVVFGWLPWWVTSLLSLMFTILFVMIIFRLIHLFI